MRPANNETRYQLDKEAGEAVSETLFNALVLDGLPMRYERFVIQESLNPATNFTELRKRL